MKTKIQVLRNMLNKLKTSLYSNCLAKNSTIKYVPFKGYSIFAGSINPLFEGTFEEVKEYIQNEIDFENYCE